MVGYVTAAEHLTLRSTWELIPIWSWLTLLLLPCGAAVGYFWEGFTIHHHTIVNSLAALLFWGSLIASAYMSGQRKRPAKPKSKSKILLTPTMVAIFFASATVTALPLTWPLACSTRALSTSRQAIGT